MSTRVWNAFTERNLQIAKKRVLSTSQTLEEKSEQLEDETPANNEK